MELKLHAESYHSREASFCLLPTAYCLLAFVRSHFCSMKITQDLREYAEKIGLAEDEALKKGLEEKAKAFAEAGNEIYVKEQ